MSLIRFVGMPDVRAKLKPLRPKPPRKLSVPLRVEPRSNRYQLVGTAFDYLLRFELQRSAPHATSERWVAEYAPGMIWQGIDFGSVATDLLIESEPEQLAQLELESEPEQLAPRADVVLRNARAALAAYLNLKAPHAAKQAELAAHAIRLAKLDSAYRASKLEPGFEQASPEDIQDLVDLLAIVPFNDLLHDKVLLLNPTFGQASLMTGGGDTDLIAGDLLVDFKTTKQGGIDVKDLDQILGYFLLARKQRSFDPNFPTINRVGLYYCRHGYLWSVKSSTWTSHPEFPGIEQWFFQRADEVFGASRKAGK
jgi:hypothetical protein